ncbi:hypothetical protein EBU95_12860 [bacterium]|nr:hypothetical protein [bacterium]
MYAAIRYFNYRKEVSFKILKTFKNFKNAYEYAFECAQDDFGEDAVVEGVSEKRVYVDDEIEGYTKGDGYDQFVYTVIEIPEPEDEEISRDCVESEQENLVDDETGFEIEKQSQTGRYDWGFDLTDFNEEGDDEEGEDEGDEEGDEDREPENKGAIKFQELLNKFDLELVSVNKGFMWENEGSIVLVTGNNPLTGKYYDNSRHPEKGYLSYVGVSCESPQLLQKFINEFRGRATYIKGESNARVYI